MGELDNDCPGCLIHWVKTMTLREAELGCSMLAWLYEPETKVVIIFYGNSRTGKVTTTDELHDPNDMNC